MGSDVVDHRENRRLPTAGLAGIGASCPFEIRVAKVGSPADPAVPDRAGKVSLGAFLAVRVDCNERLLRVVCGSPKAVARRSAYGATSPVAGPSAHACYTPGSRRMPAAAPPAPLG